MAYDNLFQPLQIGSCTVPNRIVRTAHSTGTTGEDLIAYHEERARGGVGLTIIEIAGVQPSSATAIPVFTDAVLPFYEELTRRMHVHGTKVFQQLWHGGAAYARAGQPVSASAVPAPSVNMVPRPMTQTMIDETVAAFAAAAARCRDGGLDGVELHGAHGYLIGQFLSPATNLRDDRYGGTLENRTRFLVEILEAIRNEVGPGFPVGVRLSGTDFIEGGIDQAEAAAIARHIEPLVDFLDISMGSYWRFHKFLSTLDDPLGYEIESSEQVTREVSVPTIVTGRIMTLDHASHLVETGVADMVSLVRAMVADPYLVAKARDGREHEIRPCIGTSMGCVAQLMTTGRLQCVVNVAAGKERSVEFETPAPAPVQEEGARHRRWTRRAGGSAHRRAARPRGAPVRDEEPPRRTGPNRRIGATPCRPRGDHPVPRRRDHPTRCPRPPAHTGRSRSRDRAATRRRHRRNRIHTAPWRLPAVEPVHAGTRRRPCLTCTRCGTCSASADAPRSVATRSSTTTRPPSRPSPQPTRSSPPAPT